MKNYWTTIKGEKILFEKLTDSHLINIILFVEKKAKKGLALGIDCGWGDGDYQEYDSIVIRGKEVLDMMNYQGLIAEAKKRKLLIKENL
jgi:hypothetical protein